MDGKDVRADVLTMIRKVSRKGFKKRSVFVAEFDTGVQRERKIEFAHHKRRSLNRASDRAHYSPHSQRDQTMDSVEAQELLGAYG